ncbi:hypothetical protein [Paracidovorax anthurii]|uniref:Uncharacterized protein n=1 Tax=Paracidovorax anthurii TaxID=78229 RepID=A0A328ZM59_9BURK|nr:hypothetical protein [Paracidovorax anthurii]RAR85782.1 hypothetical protein AX018_100310 [Paracidovorax anthurii]
MNLRTTHRLGLAFALLLLAAGVGMLQAGTPDTRDPGEAMAPASSSTVLSVDLIEAYNQGGGLRDFIQRALARPEAGGVFYATQILRKCRTVLAAMPAPKGPAPSPGAAAPDAAPQADTALAAANTLHSRCAGLSPDDMADDRIARLVADGLHRKDPLLTMATHAGTSTYQAPERRSSLLFDLMATRDPLLVQDVASRIAVRTDPQTGARGYRFDGTFYPQVSDAGVDLAFYLLPCGLGLDCTPRTDWDLLIRCANGFECATSRQAHVAAVLRGDPAAYERVMEMYRRMLAAIQGGQIASFI